MKKIKLPFFAIALIAIVASCKKTDAVTSSVPKITNGVYTLNQGALGHNDASLTYYDFGTVMATTNYYKDVNNFGFGDDASDFIVYGGKIYIVVNNSGNVAVANAFTDKYIDSISFIQSGVNIAPENIVGYGSNVFVSSTNGTVAVIDTTTLTISKFITVGKNPAQMVVSGNNLYVSNTGAIDAITSNIYDSTLSIINLNTLAVTGTIKVGINPGSIAADNSGNLYVACAGNYSDVQPTLVKVNTNSNSVTLTTDTAVTAIRFYNNFLYVTPAYGSAIDSVRQLNTSDFSAVKTSFITDGTTIAVPYGLDIDAATGNVYIEDAIDYNSSPGKVYCFDQTGKLKFSFTTGIYPCKVVPIQQ